MTQVRPLQSSDFDHQLSLIEAQLYALNESVNKLKDLKKTMKTGTFEKPLTRKELAAFLGKSVWSIDAMARNGQIKGHLMPGSSSRVYYLSEVEAAIKKS